MSSKSLIKRNTQLVAAGNKLLANVNKYLIENNDQKIKELYKNLTREWEKENYEKVVEIANSIIGLKESEHIAYGYLGLERLVNNDQEGAFTFDKRAADLGNSNSSHNTGYCYKNGIGVAQDYSKAVYYYNRAIELGKDTASMYNLALMYFDGIGVNEDEIKGLQLCEQAANEGFVTAIHKVGSIYAFGDYGISVDYDSAIYWLEKGNELNDAVCQYTLGLVYNRRRIQSNGLYDSLAYKEKELYEKAADKGLKQAIDVLNKYY